MDNSIRRGEQIPEEDIKHKILLACERRELSSKLEAAFQAEGHEVVVVGRLVDLLRKAEGGDISLILFDLDLIGATQDRISMCGSTGNTFVILRDCCGHIELKREHLRGNVELFFFDPSEIDAITEKTNNLLKILDPFIYQKKKLQQAETNPYLQNIIGTSDKMKEVHRFIKKVAEKRIDILIAGETGTGKELVARAIHNMSKDINRAFVSINCASFQSTLIESELFGHERGAFTGAVSKHMGKLELADGGTLFLDEIGDMSLEMQAKLLRAIELKEFFRVGGEEPIRCDVRIISATNKYLPEEVEKGRFRKDLYYRISVDSIVLPPLRERKEDIPLLVEHFVDLYAQEATSRVSNISPEALSVLLKYSWPGNVRELKNCMQRAIIYCEHETILPEHLPLYLSKSKNTGDAKDLPRALEDTIQSYQVSELPDNLLGNIEERLIREIYRKTGWNQKRTATILGMAINTLRSRLSEYNIRKDGR